MNSTTILSLLLPVVAFSSACKKDKAKDTPTDTKAKATPKVQNSKPTSEAPPIVAEPAKAEWTGDDTAKAMQDCWTAFNAKDEAAFVGCYADDADFVYVDFAPAMVMKGAQAIGGVIKMWWGAFPDANASAQLLLVNKENFASIVLMTQTNTGEKGMMPPTGKKVIAFEAQVGSLNAVGKIAADHHFSDQSTMAHQMGMFPSERSPDSETAWPEQRVVVAKDDDKERANLETIKGLGSLVDASDVDGILAAVADDVEFRYVGDKTTYANKADYEKGMKEYMAMVKVTGRDVTSAWAAGDWVFTVSNVSVELLTDMPGAEGSKGKPVKTTQTEFFMLNEGKIQKHWIFENSLQYPIQLGMIDPSKMGAH